MAEREEIVRIYTKNEKAKRTIVDTISDETGLKMILPEGKIELQQSIYDETMIRILQNIIVNNELSLITIEPISMKNKKKKETTENAGEKTKRKGYGGRPNKMLEKIISCIENKKQVTMKDLEEATGSSYAGIKRNLEKLMEEGTIICIERGKWRLKNFYDDALDLPNYNSIVEYIVEFGKVSKEKMLEKFQEVQDVEYVLEELEKSAFVEKSENDTYLISLEFRVWYHIRKNPHIQWETLKVYFSQKVIDNNTLSKTINQLTKQAKITRDGKRGYVVI